MIYTMAADSAKLGIGIPHGPPVRAALLTADSS